MISGHKAMNTFKRYNNLTEIKLKDIGWKIAEGSMATYPDTKTNKHSKNRRIILPNPV